MAQLESELRFLKQMNIKPNYSALSREYNMDRHTIKKKMEGLDSPPRQKRPKPSSLDPLAEEIAQVLAAGKGITIAAAYWYFKSERGLSCTYSNFKSYVRRKSIRPSAGSPSAHPLYETDPGEVLQCDWVEDIKMTLSSGEKITFNLFSATLGYSRIHYFELTETKTESAFKRCLCHCLRFLGGTPKYVLTDNMSALVSVSGGKRTVHPSVLQFSSDIRVPIRFCRVRTPETKGKDESANRFAKRLLAYDGKIATVAELIALVARLVSAVNSERNQSTGVPPAIAFAKEKECLGPLPSAAILREYESWSHSCRVPRTQLVYFRNARYSVPPNYITKTVQVEQDEGFVYIYHNGSLIARHAAIAKGVSYSEADLRSGLSGSVGDQSKIDEYIAKTMARFKEMGAGA